MRLTVYNPTAQDVVRNTVFEVQADTFQAVFAASRAIYGTMQNVEKRTLLADCWFFLRTDDGRTIEEGRVCESKDLTP